jgi:hypothetical protein
VFTFTQSNALHTPWLKAMCWRFGHLSQAVN